VFFKTVQTPAQLARAKTAIERAVQLAPDDPAVIKGLGDYYYYGYRDYPRATEQYLRLAQLRPNDPEVFSKLGYIQRRQGRMPDALPNFRRAVELDPQTTIHYNDLLVSLIACRHYAEAESCGRQYVQINPDLLAAASQVVQLHFATHNSTEAIRAFAARNVISADRPEHLYIQLQNARFSANWAEAIRLDREQRYFDSDGDYPRFLQDVLAAATFAEAGDLVAARLRAVEALTVMNALLVEQPLNAQLWAALSLAHGLLGDRDEAVRCGAKARELLPEARDANTGAAISALCASALAYAGEKDRALAEFERLLHVPFGTHAILDRGIWSGSWKSLRDDPRFQKLINDPKNNQPLF
jgi:tetratricopeptide (TPR) repeat protein